MKAIVVVDMEENDLDMCFADVFKKDRHTGDIRIIKELLPLRPVLFKWFQFDDRSKEYYDGWNDCLDEILGETE